MNPQEIEIEEARSRADLKRFVKFPWRVYDGDPNWVPPLLVDRYDFFNRAKNPFFRHAEVKLFLARREGQIVGRVATCINNAYNEHHQVKVGVFGFFEAIEDYDVAHRLLKTAMITLAGNGMEVMRGPLSFSTNHECGLLVEGFDSPPVVMMTYNPSYYVDFFERFGLTKAKDLLAFQITGEQIPDERAHKLIERLRTRSGATFRKLNMRDFDNEVQRCIKIFNEAWQDNWGYEPLSDAETRHIAKNLKQIVDPDLVHFAEIEGETVGFSLALPDIYQVLQRLNGRLLPTGILKLLWHTKIRNKINRLRVVLMGVKPQYRKRGIDNCFYLDAFEIGGAKGYRTAELSWILENNNLMISALERLGARRYKTYRIYESPLIGGGNQGNA
jgi:GNAT superfamily N-acetyltransferase